MKPYYETKLGKLYHGDCLEIMPELELVDLVLTDPPYGINHAEWDSKYISIENLLFEKSPSVLINCGDKNIATCINAMGDKYKGMYYGWNMNGMTRGPLGYMNVIPVVCGGKLKRGMNFCKFSIQDLTRKNHPSPKPIEYYIKILLRFSEINQLILDTFLGSGTTSVACERLKRRWIGIEKEEEYCENSAKRIEENLTVMERIERSEKGITKKTGLLF